MVFFAASMGAREDITAFMLRWSLSLPEKRIFQEFRTRITSAVREFQREWDTGSGIDLAELEKIFASINGSVFRPDTHAPASNMRSFCSDAETFHLLILVVQRIFWAIRDYRQASNVTRAQAYAVNMLVSRVNQAIAYSPGINLRKLEINDGAVDLYPEGVAVLDRELVDSVASWLAEFPDVAAEYRTALTMIVAGETPSFRHALDSLRFALEKLLKLVLANNFPLESQQQPLLKWMKEYGIHAQIRNNYATLLDQFAKFQNDFVKHDNDPTSGRSYSLHETEYVVYLTGALMRLILRIRGAA